MPEQKAIPMVYVDQATRKIHDGDVAIAINEKKAPPDSLVSNKDYHPTKIIGACSVCKTVGVLEFPFGFSYNIGDRVMQRKKVVVDCIACNKRTEFIPLQINGQKTQEGCELLKQMEENIQKPFKDGTIEFKEGDKKDGK